ncbi:unnamed protein product [Parnassius apollo]|uniref:(apollo) hypothetical protein n=1 Tax=Parnassius apollo TaxID=110799 RepID=A0A8S3XZV5_PARAO|nr:unnamed protein product [Parnassius apollo]
MDKATTKRIIRYYEDLWYQKSGVFKPKLLKLLPFPLQTEICYDLNAVPLYSSLIFRKLPEAFLRRLSVTMSHRFYLPGDIIYNHNQNKTDMICVTNGVLELLSDEDDESPMISFSKGTCFGEIALILNIPARCTVKAATYVECQILKKTDFTKLMITYPNLVAQIRKDIQERIDRSRLRKKKQTSNDQLLLNIYVSKERKKSSIKCLKDKLRYRQGKTDVDLTKDNELDENCLDLYILSEHIKKRKLNFTCINSNFPWILESDCYLANVTKTKFPLITSIYFATTLLLSVGYGDFIPGDKCDMGLVAFLSLYGVLLTGYCISEFSSVVTHWSRTKTAFLEVIITIDKFMKENNMSQAIKSRIMAFYELQWQYNSGVELTDESWLDTTVVPTELRKKVLHQARFKALTSIKFFQVKNKAYIQTLTETARDIILPPGEIVYYGGTISRELYIIERGYCLVTSKTLKDGKKERVIGPGNHLGLLVMLYGVPAVNTVVTLTHCKIHKLYAAFWTESIGALKRVGSWLDEAKTFKIKNITPTKAYLLAYYWSATSFSGAGFGDILAQDTTHMILSICINVHGVLFFGYVYARMASLKAMADQMITKFQENLKHLELFLSSEKVALLLKRSIIDYWKYQWKRTGGWSHQTILGKLHSNLNEDAVLFMYEKTLREIPLFENVEYSFFRAFAKQLKENYFQKGYMVIRSNEVISNMYIIYRGKVDIISDSNEVEACMGPGGIFGNIRGASRYRTRSNIVASRNIDLLSIEGPEFYAILKSYPSVLKKVKQSFDSTSADYVIPTVMSEEISLVQPFSLTYESGADEDDVPDINTNVDSPEKSIASHGSRSVTSAGNDEFIAAKYLLFIPHSTIAIWASILTHVNACLFFKLSCLTPVHCTSANWMSKEELSLRAQYAEGQYFSLYVASLWYMMNLLTITGTGDVSSQNDFEVIETIIIIIIIKFCTGLLISEMSAMITAHSSSRIAYDYRINELRDGLRDTDLSEHQTNKMWDYVCELWNRQQGRQVEVLTVHQNLTESIYDVLGPEDCFGLAQGLFVGVQHYFSFRARTVVDIVYLKLDEWKYLLDFYPKSAKLVRKKVENVYLAI